MKVIKITGNMAFSERPAAMFSVLYGNVPLTGRLTPWVGLLTGSGLLVVGITFLTMKTFLNNRAPPLASSTLTPFF